MSTKNAMNRRTKSPATKATSSNQKDFFWVLYMLKKH